MVCAPVVVVPAFGTSIAVAVVAIQVPDCGRIADAPLPGSMMSAGCRRLAAMAAALPFMLLLRRGGRAAEGVEGRALPAE